MVKKNEDAGAPTDAPATTLADALAEGSGASSKSSPGPVPADPVSISPEQLVAAIERAVHAWGNLHMFNTPISRATPALNYLRDQALPELAPAILKEVF